MYNAMHEQRFMGGEALALSLRYASLAFDWSIALLGI
jgi:hypothetical protein